MIFKPTESGGRIALGYTPFGDYRVEWDAGGGLVSVLCEIKTPADAAIDLPVINAHLAECKKCPHAGDVTTTKNNRDIYTIRCGSKRKGCGAVQLRHAGRCPEGHW